ncbi:MAG: hypothetical protein ACREDD_13330, partial [Methylocella sp.]
GREAAADPCQQCAVAFIPQESLDSGHHKPLPQAANAAARKYSRAATFVTSVVSKSGARPRGTLANHPRRRLLL